MSQVADFEPIDVLYKHFHDAIRAELVSLEAALSRLDAAAASGTLTSELQSLKDRYIFLQQIYNYHSSVEDEVVYPALEAKVKNVTQAYTVEHENEERLFEELSPLLVSAAEQGTGEALRALACKVEQIHTTLRTHLRKEENQLLPLLRSNFSAAEQAEQVTQFLCCIPLAEVEDVLSWLKPHLPPPQHAALLQQVRKVVPDKLLLQLLESWLASAADPAAQALQPSQVSDAICAPPPAPVTGVAEAASLSLPQCTTGCCLLPADDTGGQLKESGSQAKLSLARSRLLPPPDARIGSLAAEGSDSLGAGTVCAAEKTSSDEVSNFRTGDIESVAASNKATGNTTFCCRMKLQLPPSNVCGGCDCDGGSPSSSRAPLQEVLHIHDAIRGNLASFAAEARSLEVALSPGGALGASQLGSLVERHRFLRAVCSCHTASEAYVLLPAARALCQGTATNMQLYDEEHDKESALFDNLGRLLAEVKAFARRGAAEATQLTQELSAAVDVVRGTLCKHMLREELEVLPLLQAHLCDAEQRSMVWRMLRAMPLRLLQQVMPVIAGKLSGEEMEDMLKNMRLAAPAGDEVLVQLLTRWASASRRTAAPSQSCRRESADCITTHSLSYTDSRAGLERPATDERAAKRTRRSPVMEETGPQSSASEDMAHRVEVGAHTSTAETGLRSRSNPIDHIFQFHKALKRDLVALEESAQQFNAAVQESNTPHGFSAMVSQIEGHFKYMWGMYRAHSLAEDEIVFPALEAKEQLLNVSHAYTLDHEQEEELLKDLHQVLLQLRQVQDLAELRLLAGKLHRGCAALRASLEQHVQAEEQELWPLFAENFSTGEQERLIGVIIGRTGAEVLQSLLPWVTGSFTTEELRSMMESLRSATRNTAFERWLATTIKPEGHLTIEPSNPNNAAFYAAGSHNPAASHAAGSSPSAGETGPAAHAYHPPHSPDSADSTVPESEAGPRVQHGRMSTQSMNNGGRSRNAATAASLDEVAHYLVARAASAEATADSQPGSMVLAPPVLPAERALPGNLQSCTGGTDADPFRPGWKDIFSINQKQLESAVRRITGDPSLEPQRKNYLVQHIMASRYVVAQQMRLEQAYAEPSVGLNRTYASPDELGCAHYQRRCKVVAPCCNRTYTCRECHDEAETDHDLDSKQVEEMLCMECNTQQPAAGKCCKCGHIMAAYYCDICHLWDNNPEHHIYHCPYCNLCRQGLGLGLDSCHCMQCNTCMHLSDFSRHKCRTLNPCPICQENLYESTKPYRELPRCGHFMHSHCFKQHTQEYYTCPLCLKSLGDMAVYIQMIDSLLVKEMPLHPDLASQRQQILCRECEGRSVAPFHFVYHKCQECGSYNTAVV